ncbi:hypothetical protein HanIR_Chr12g0612741 [Helianthus annuus]|nr:hypothetical protein HanIR_Chr12g0612741 [Helianthus annuus]
MVWHEPCYNSLIAFYSTSMEILMILLELVKLKRYYCIRHMDKCGERFFLLWMIEIHGVWNTYCKDGDGQTTVWFLILNKLLFCLDIQTTHARGTTHFGSRYSCYHCFRHV